MAIKTGDTVFHAPSGEKWLVAYVDGDRLAWCGWPPGIAALSDCTLLKSCSDGEHLELLHRLAEMRENDARKSHAIRALELLSQQPV